MFWDGWWGWRERGERGIERETQIERKKEKRPEEEDGLRERASSWDHPPAKGSNIHFSEFILLPFSFFHSQSTSSIALHFNILFFIDIVVLVSASLHTQLLHLSLLHGNFTVLFPSTSFLVPCLFLFSSFVCHCFLSIFFPFFILLFSVFGGDSFPWINFFFWVKFQLQPYCGRPLKATFWPGLCRSSCRRRK